MLDTSNTAVRMRGRYLHQKSQQNNTQERQDAESSCCSSPRRAGRLSASMVVAAGRRYRPSSIGGRWYTISQRSRGHRFLSTFGLLLRVLLFRVKPKKNESMRVRIPNRRKKQPLRLWCTTIAAIDDRRQCRRL